MKTVTKYRVYLIKSGYAVQELFDDPAKAIELGYSYKAPFRIEWVEVSCIHQKPVAITHVWSYEKGLVSLDPQIFLEVN